MKVKEWNVNLNGKNCSVEFYPSMLFKFFYKLIVNQELCREVKHKLFNGGAVYQFQLEGYDARIEMKTTRFRSKYQLVVDGITYAEYKYEDLE